MKRVLVKNFKLSSPTPREFSAGLAEVIKYGLIVDAEFFEWLEQNIERLVALDSATLITAIRRCCEIKASIIAEDEREHVGGAQRQPPHSRGVRVDPVTEPGLHAAEEPASVEAGSAAKESELMCVYARKREACSPSCKKCGRRA